MAITPGRRAFPKTCLGTAAVAAVGLPSGLGISAGASTGDVRDPAALPRPGGAATVSTRAEPIPPPAWPPGTTASASSAHAPNGGDNGTPTTYDASNPTTFLLTITAPRAMALPGSTLLSDADGAVRVDGRAVRSATITGIAGSHVTTVDS